MKNTKVWPNSRESIPTAGYEVEGVFGCAREANQKISLCRNEL